MTQQLIREAVKIEQMELEHANMDDEEIEGYGQDKKKATEFDKYGENTDYNACQESVENFGQKMADKHGPETSDLEIGKEEELRTSFSMKVEDSAKNRAEARDNYGNEPDSPPSISSLMHMTSFVRNGLGCTIDMVDKNIGIIQKWRLLEKSFIGKILLTREKKEKVRPALQFRLILEMLIWLNYVLIKNIQTPR